jgi:hypothetical protein
MIDVEQKSSGTALPLVATLLAMAAMTAALLVAEGKHTKPEVRVWGPQLTGQAAQ